MALSGQAEGKCMRDNPESHLVSTNWLSRNLDDPGIRILDVRWKSRFENGRGIGYDDFDGYAEGHIPGAVFVRMADDLSDPDASFADALIDADRFAEVMGRLGIDSETRVIAYDDTGIPFGSARLWWALNRYGHDNVQVLDGGLHQWKLESRPLSTTPPDGTAKTFVADPRPGWLATKSEVLASLDDDVTTIVDCLSPDQYRGETGNHQWGQRAGHIPGAVNVPAIANIDAALVELSSEERIRLAQTGQSFCFADDAELNALYETCIRRKEAPVIAYCGRGFAAACGVLALRAIGYRDVRLYDGSWAEWGNDESLSVETGDGAIAGS